MKNLILGILLIISGLASAQSVGINASGATPDPSAVLDISAPDKGLLIPRISLNSSSDAASIPNPANALIVYNINSSVSGGLSGAGLYMNKGTASSPNWLLMSALPQSGILLSETMVNSTLTNAGYESAGKIQLPQVTSTTKSVAAGKWLPAASFNELAGTSSVNIGNRIAFFGLYNQAGPLASVFLYDPLADEWELASSVNAPIFRYSPLMAWTGAKLIVWGGSDENGQNVYTGGIYDPVSKLWTTMNTSGISTYGSGFRICGYNAPSNEFIVWGSRVNDDMTGYKYKLGTNTWTPMTNTNSPNNWLNFSGCVYNNKLVIWGGFAITGVPVKTGGVYEVNSDKWFGMSTAAAPSAREQMTFHCTPEGRLLIWGGKNGGTLYKDGGIYNTGLDLWETPIPNAPVSGNATGAYANGKWGILANTGAAILDISSNSWTSVYSSILPASRNGAISGAANDILFFYGGRPVGAPNDFPLYYKTGSRYFTVPKTAVEQTSFNENFYLFKKN